MALLVFLAVWFLPASLSWAQFKEPATVVIYFDSGEAEQSVAIFDETIIRVGDIYGPYRVKSFSPEAVVMESVETRATFRFYVQGEPDEETARLARHRFIAHQMKLIHEAQMEHRQKQEDRFAASLEELIEKGFLADGFENGHKQGYRFEMVSTGESGRRAPLYETEPLFLAAARPVSVENGLYFSVDQLGQIRYGDTEFLATWGPVWDYWDPGKPRQKTIQVDEQL